MFKMVVHVRSDELIDIILVESSIDMSQDDLLMKRKCIQFTHSKKGLMLAMCPKAANLKYM